MKLKALLLASVAFPSSAHAATFTRVNDPTGNWIEIEGEILVNDLDNLRAWSQTAFRTDEPIAGFILNSPGGNVGGALAIADQIHSVGWRTHVRPNEECASACFYIWAAGKRSAASTARIGVHSAVNLQGYEDGNSDTTNVKVPRKLKVEYGVPDAIIGKMLTTVQPNMAWLTPDDIASMTGDAAPVRTAQTPVQPPPVTVYQPPSYSPPVAPPTGGLHRYWSASCGTYSMQFDSLANNLRITSRSGVARDYPASSQNAVNGFIVTARRADQNRTLTVHWTSQGARLLAKEDGFLFFEGKSSSDRCNNVQGTD
jgi:hypothetical protein